MCVSTKEGIITVRMYVNALKGLNTLA